MTQLNDAETKFFESGRQEMAPSLSEGLPERTETALPTAAKPVRQEKFVPLQALQQERAEK